MTTSAQAEANEAAKAIKEETGFNYRFNFTRYRTKFYLTTEGVKKSLDKKDDFEINLSSYSWQVMIVSIITGQEYSNYPNKIDVAFKMAPGRVASQIEKAKRDLVAKKRLADKLNSELTEICKENA